MGPGLAHLMGKWGRVLGVVSLPYAPPPPPRSGERRTENENGGGEEDIQAVFLFAASRSRLLSDLLLGYIF